MTDTDRQPPCPTCARLIHARVPIDLCPGDGLCRRCALRNCRCTHTAPCDKGFIETIHDVTGYDAVRRCPQCALASFNAGQAMPA